MKKLVIFCLVLGFVLAIGGTAAFADGPEYEVTKYENLAYGTAVPGNLLDLYVPDVPGNATLPLVIWHSGSAWFSNSWLIRRRAHNIGTAGCCWRAGKLTARVVVKAFCTSLPLTRITPRAGLR